jgi:hypothetical protein
VTALSERWPDSQTFPGESKDNALRRRVKMHEFLATGGVQLGIDPATKRMTYSGPVDPATTPECPWHPDYPGVAPCAAWEEIKAGRGSGEVVSPTLAELRDRTPEELRDARERIRVARDQAEGIFDQTRNVPGEDPRIQRPAPKPAPRTSPSGSSQNKMAWYDDPDLGAHRVSETRPRLEDARDTAMSSLGGEVPDEIIIDGDEDEEGEE